ncbi:MAG: AgmX/PglI C-terminal domain-containing protein [Nannocystales bacterium]
MRKTISSMILASVALSMGCSFIARGEDQYRTDTRALLETRNADVRSCYDKELANNPALSGDVVVNFTVEKKTGAIMNATAAEGSTAPESLQTCVVTAVDGLALTPEDRRDGQATFTYTFTGPAAG